MVLVDTDVMVDVLRSYPPAMEWMRTRAAENLTLPGFVLLELIEGCPDKSGQDRVLKLAKRCEIAWLSEEASDRAATLFGTYRLSRGLDMIDALIGQTALELNATLLTFNQKHYACVPGLETAAPYDRM
jgi:predicted nucleic acid-binding protein